MTKKILTLLTFLIMHLCSHAEYGCYVRIRMNDCSNCLSAIDDIKYISDRYQKYFVLDESQRADSVLIEKKLHLSKYNVHIVWSDKIMAIDDAPISTVLFVNDQNGYFTFPLNRLKDNVSYVNDLVSEKSTLLKDGFNGFDHCSIARIGTSGVFFLDTEFGKVYELDRKSRKMTHVYESTEALEEKAYLAKFHSLDQYNIINSISKKINIVDAHTILKCDLYNDTLYLLAKNMQVKINGQDTGLMNFYTIYQYYNGALINVLPIDADGFISDNYYLTSIDFLCHGSDFYFVVNRTKFHDYSNKILAHCKLVGDRIVFSDLLKLNLPNEYIDYRIFNNYTVLAADFPYFMVHLSDQLFNINTGHIDTLNNLFGIEWSKQPAISDYSVKRSIWQMKVYGNVCYAIIRESGMYYYVKYSVSDKKLLYKKELGNFSTFVAVPKIDAMDYNYVFLCPDKSTLIREKAN